MLEGGPWAMAWTTAHARGRGADLQALHAPQPMMICKRGGGARPARGPAPD